MKRADDLLGSGVGLAAGLSGLGDQAALGSEAPDLDVVIVGAGVSGLTAAYQLSQVGRTTVVLEAQPQIGGRLQRLQVGSFHRSAAHAVPGWIDLGGQWVGHTQTKTLEYAKRLNISTFPVPTGGKDTFFMRGGSVVTIMLGPRRLTTLLICCGIGQRWMSPRTSEMMLLQPG